ncbi:MAG: hypothetical protein MUO63_14395 [Desulfobulbaceae bacterium]|nr:hypothetical protein [Desulfobulbaceae bacterium]
MKSAQDSERTPGHMAILTARCWPARENENNLPATEGTVVCLPPCCRDFLLMPD